MEILEISPYKGKVCELLLDNGEKLYLHRELIAEEGLCKGDVLSTEKREALLQRAAERRTYEYALYLLERRSYSYRGLYNKLMSAQNAQEAAVFHALERLMRCGLLDDTAYAESLARHYVEGKHFGLRRAAMEMSRQGLAQEEIWQALAKYDNEELLHSQLLELMHRKYARYLTDETDWKARERVTASLARRGYTFRDIRDALEDYFAEVQENEEDT